MSICKKCILPDYYPGIKMDEEGVCNFCRDHVHIEKLKEELESKSYELDGIISDARKNRIASNGVYDAIVPISGGKDSAYVAYVLKKKYNLNILAITYDNGFLSGYAKDNVWNIANKLDIDLVVLKPKWSLMKKLFASMMRETNEFCNVCNSMGYLLVASYVMRMAKCGSIFP
ncbi:hypothetical protein [Ruminiclostridium josui]|uniref:hypothetical protein n=1 Tax=Ruminiclostridium josui TaxID=1499 RepID=UPI0006D1DE69|nr:hypothetical protein [Ruminiclostridium josui]